MSPTRRALALLALLATAALGACGDDDGDRAGAATTAPPAEPGAEPEAPDLSDLTLRVADQGDGTFLRTPLEVAGVDDTPYEIEWSNFAAGPPMLEAFQAGAIDVGWVADTPPLVAQAAGLDIRIVGVSRNRGDNMRIVTREGSGIEELADLEGRSVAFTRGTTIQAYLAAALDEAGLDQGDIEPVDVPPTDLLTVFQSGQVDAVAMPVQLLVAYEADHDDAVVVRNGEGLTTGQLYLITRTSVLEDPVRSAAIGDLLVRLHAAYEHLNAHPDVHVQEIFVGRQGLSPELGQRLLDDQGATSWIPIDDEVIARHQRLADLLAAVGGIASEVDAAEGFDTRFNELLEAAADAPTETDDTDPTPTTGGTP